MLIDAILLGAGDGNRCRHLPLATSPQTQISPSLPKQFQLLGQYPVFVYSLIALKSIQNVRQVILVVAPDYSQLVLNMLDEVKHLAFPFAIKVLDGGATRFESSKNAILYLNSEQEEPPIRVLIHDACRPYFSKDFIQRIQNKLLDRSYGAWVPVIPESDTLKKVTPQHQVVETLDRDQIVRVQTPQIFEFQLIRSLMLKTQDNPKINFLDDASLCEYYGIPVGTFKGDFRNLKLTYSFEHSLLQTLIAQNGHESVLADT